jgi:hypothetical protein
VRELSASSHKRRPSDEARRIAADVAKLPEMLRQGYRMQTTAATTRLGLLPTHHEHRDRPKAGEAKYNAGFSPKHLSTVREIRAITGNKNRETSAPN